jgi:arylsulfatase B
MLRSMSFWPFLPVSRVWEATKLGCSGLLLLPLLGCYPPEVEDLPNVVLIITDDQGYGDLGCHGNPVLKTPNLDRLYAQSIRLVDYHVAPTCSPTRAALQTGHWTNRTGVWHTIMGRSMLRENEVTIGQVFQDAGYATGMFGKWHLGDNYPFRPEDRGYDQVLRHGGGGVGQTPDYWDNAYFDGAYFKNSQVEPVEGFCTDVWFRYAKDFITAQNELGKPFFVYISTNAPHGPMHSPESFAEPYLDQKTDVAHFFGMIANIDENVGRLKSFLEQQGLAENTIFIFTTDNGTSTGEAVYNAGMRGRKGSEYDGGHRVPFFIYWPRGGLAGGRDVTPITAHVDVLPTLIDLCGIEGPAGIQFDGRSIRPLLEGVANQSDGTWPDRILVTDSQRVKDPIKWRKSSVMTSRWRLINGEELYDIQDDPGQQNNVAANHPEVKKRLRRFYDDWWAELKPTFNRDTRIYLGHPSENPARLTSHDWITTQTTPWNQAQVRDAMQGPSVTGFWNVRVWESGTYEIRLRRWPEEAGAGIDVELAAGDAVPGERAFRARPGKAIPVVRATVQVGGQKSESSIEAGALEAVFRMHLEEGAARMNARFYTGDGREFGAYYAYVERLSDY